MQTRPPDLDDTDVAAAVSRAWGRPGCAVAYVPVGFGSHHWAVEDSSRGRWFASVDVLDGPGAFDRLAAALGASTVARESGLTFVVAPTRTEGGRVVVRLGERYALALYPYVDGAAGRFSDRLTEEETSELVAMLAALHAVPPVGVGRDTFVIPGRELLEATLRSGPGTSRGPYVDRLRALLGQHGDAVGRALAEHDRLLDVAGPQHDRMVLTHGEPHPGNLLRTPDGLRLVDWETTLLAPPERDLWLVDARSGGRASAEYTAITGLTPRPELLDRYDLAWSLADVADYAHSLGHAADETEDTVWSWEALEGTVRDLAARFT